MLCVVSGGIFGAIQETEREQGAAVCCRSGGGEGRGQEFGASICCYFCLRLLPAPHTTTGESTQLTELSVAATPQHRRLVTLLDLVLVLVQEEVRVEASPQLPWSRGQEAAR